jgi:hypothetical protein
MPLTFLLSATIKQVIILSKVPASRLSITQNTNESQLFLHESGKVHNSRHRDLLLSETMTCGARDDFSILCRVTDFAKL